MIKASTIQGWKLFLPCYFIKHSVTVFARVERITIMAASSMIMYQMSTAPAAALTRSSNLQCSKLTGAASPSLATFRTRTSRMVRCEAGNDRVGGLREAVDQASKKTITKDDILRNQETNESEKKSVFGTEPTSGSFYPRPEVERRPETGDKSFTSLFAFDGAAPETINGRLVRTTIPSGFHFY